MLTLKIAVSFCGAIIILRIVDKLTLLIDFLVVEDTKIPQYDQIIYHLPDPLSMVDHWNHPIARHRVISRTVRSSLN